MRLGLATWAGVAICGVAVAAPTPRQSPALAEGLRREAFEAVARDESSWRDKARENFPTDAWSQDDDFAASESTRARDFANERGVSRSSVWSAIDEGIREGLAAPDGGRVRASVAPCRPRPIY